jgi:hypothetical protein
MFAENAIIATATAQDANEDGVRPVAHLVQPHGTLYLWTLDGVDLEHSAKSAIEAFAIGGRDLCDGARFMDVEWTPGSARLALEETLANLELDGIIVGCQTRAGRDGVVDLDVPADVVVTLDVDYWDGDPDNGYTDDTRGRLNKIEAALGLHGLRRTSEGSDDADGAAADERTEYHCFSA